MGRWSILESSRYGWYDDLQSGPARPAGRRLI